MTRIRLLRVLRNHSFLVQDSAIVIVSIYIAVVLVRSGILSETLMSIEGFGTASAFFAGMFFTSVFTTAPAIASLAEIASATSVLQTAFWGACGAVAGDFIIFKFIRDRLSMHTAEIAGHRTLKRRLHILIKLKYARWITVLLAGMLIASPLPDELGIGLLGFSRVSTQWFLPLSFASNFIGILLIGAVAYTL